MDRVRELLREKQSPSYLQRMMKISYKRAENMMVLAIQTDVGQPAPTSPAPRA
jgi:hypothetical protein